MSLLQKSSSRSGKTNRVKQNIPTHLPYVSKEARHDIGFEDGVYLNTVTRCLINRHGTLSLQCGLVAGKKSLVYQHVIGEVNL